MKLNATAIFILAAISAVTVAAQPSTKASSGGAELTGKVIDGVEHTPLVGAVVKLEKSDGKSVKEVITEQDGAYKVTGLTPHGEYRVTYSKEQYVPDVKTVIVSAQQNGELLKQHAGDDYWRRKAVLMKERIQQTPQALQPASFLESWQELRSSALSAEAKAAVARGLKSVLDSGLWSKSTSFQIYADADPRALSRAEQLLWSNTNDPVVSTLDPTLVQDIKSARARVQPDKGAFIKDEVKFLGATDTNTLSGETTTGIPSITRTSGANRAAPATSAADSTRLGSTAAGTAASATSTSKKENDR